MSEVLFNNNGVPLIATGKSYFASTTGAPVEKPKKKSKQIIRNDDKTTVGNYTIASWGANNDFPTKSVDIIKRVGVLNTGLKFTRNFTLGQGIFPCRVTGYNPDGSEILEVIDDKDLINFCQGRMVRRYLEEGLRDIFKLGSCDVNILMNADGSKAVGLETLNGLYKRYTQAEKGRIENLILSGEFPNTPSEGKYEVYPVLDNYDPAADLIRRRIGGETAGKSFVFSVKDSWSNNDYYPEPLWYSAYLAGWVDIAMKVPKFLARAYDNQISWMWHVQIPYAFWDKRFPESNYKDKGGIAAREAAIQEYLDNIEETLTGTENANKALFTFFEINPNNGKVEEQWIITPLDNKYKEGDKLITSAAANSEIMFAIMINPNVMGAGMPGGTYSGNQGGSNIREAFLVNIANAWVDRQNILDPLECFLKFNGYKDVQLRFMSTVLTTLDSGSGTKNNLA